MIRSASGSGTTVRVLLPTIELTGLSGTATEEELRAWEAEGIILVADDEEAVAPVQGDFRPQRPNIFGSQFALFHLEQNSGSFALGQA